MRADGSFGRLRIRGAKIFADGVLENFTGALLEPYGDGRGGTTGNRGLSQIDPEAAKPAWCAPIR